MVLLLSQYPCAKSSSELQLKFAVATEAGNEATVFAGIEPHAEVERRRFFQAESNVIPLRKRLQRACWQHRTTWAIER
jgi:recombination protein RecA